MKIAFYAPLKAPDHPVPSGDRLMARQLVEALTLSGHDVGLVSRLRSFSATSDVLPDDLQAAEMELQRVASSFARDGLPDLWFCYHPYYKAPDRLGPVLARRFGFPYVTCESSYSGRRNIGGWAQSQSLVRDGAAQAAVNICLTERDLRGLREAVPEGRFARLAPFIEPRPFLVRDPQPRSKHMVAVAMMRSGDKLSSYTALAESLSQLLDIDWHLTIAGDGPARGEVEAAFAGIPAERLTWAGELGPDRVAQLLSTAALYLWPGHGEAYGLAYLEAQAAGVPVIAEAVAGVPEVVADGQTGMLTPPGDRHAYAGAIRDILANENRRQILSGEARRFVREERSMDAAAKRFDAIIRTHVGGTA
ncbi:glycosyltransferase family 4 protein [Rhizobium sp. 0TCS1.26]|uniref:glycosyltransferase family 4 protein n=1 Tax=Rhizobium sp. 0TCS1.26 TaxID=3142623 RepID=UPI003D296D1F